METNKNNSLDKDKLVDGDNSLDKDKLVDGDNSLDIDKPVDGDKPLSISGQLNLPGLPSDLSSDMVIVIDKEKLPEDIRKMLDEVLSLGQPKSSHTVHEKDREAKPLFALQAGTVIGNIYDKNFKLDNR